MIAGVVVVWSGDGPCFVTHRLPAVIENVTITSDIARVSFVQAGGSAVAVVEDVELFEGATIVRTVGQRGEGGLVVAATSRPALRALDDAANAEDHVLLVGSRKLGEVLATRYATKLGRYHRFRPGGDQPLDHMLSTREGVRTVILDLVRSVPEHDVTALAHWFETDIRFVTLCDSRNRDWIPALIRDRATRIDLVGPRFDEIPTIVHDRVTSAIEGATLHASAIVELLRLLARTREDDWFESFDDMLKSWRQAKPRPMYVDADVERAWRSLR